MSLAQHYQLLLLFLILYSCWLSTEKGTVFAFVVPMIVIIIVSETSLFAYILVVKIMPTDQHSVLGVWSGSIGP